jgi:RNA polymerase sigma-70 factor (ECF subfamily)
MGRAMAEPVPTGAKRIPVLGQEVLERARRRDPEALNAVFTAFFDSAYAYLIHLLREPVLVDDVVQEAFIRMHAAIDRLDVERDPAPWVFTILTNAARDHWRSRAHKNRWRHVGVEEAWNHADEMGWSNPEHVLERREDATAIQRALSQLSPADREILLLREYEGMSAREVAEALKLTLEAARQRHSRAVRRLAALYERTEREAHE